MKAPNQLYIDGVWRNSGDGESISLIDPATEERIDAVPRATEADLDEALDAAGRAFREWREVDAWTRSRKIQAAGAWIREHQEDIARALTEDQGKPLAEARGEVGAAADQFEWYAGEAKRIYGRLIDGHSRDHRLMVMRQPVGPVAAFSPWNFPCLLTARKLAPALAAGCSIVVKPPIEAPRSALYLARACEEAGVPAGVVQMVTGLSGQISTQLIRSPVIRKVSLTGSVPVGVQVAKMCAEEVKPVSLELGGHSPVLVFEDADVEQAAEITARGKFRNNGQVCIAASRFFVQESVAERYTKRFVEVARSLRMGHGLEEGVDVGPLANAKRLEATRALVEDAVARGAGVAAGGRRPDGFEKGFYFEPTVLTDVSQDMALMTEEPFCPIAPITTFTDLEDGLAKANATDFGLAGYVFTSNTRTAFLASEGLDAGMIGVNNLVIATAEIPFGGVKKSGYGREGGTEWIHDYTVGKYINILL